MNLSWFLLQTGGPHMKLSAGLVVAAAVLALAPPSWAAPGDLDLSFGVGGKTVAPLDAEDGGRWHAAPAADGKVVIAGHAASLSNGDPGFSLGRLNSDGSLDASFADMGIQSTAVPGATFVDSALGMQSDGKIVVGGSSLSSACGETGLCVILARYNSGGSLDTSFGVAGVAKISIGSMFGTGSGGTFDLALQGDGKIVVVGGTPNSWASGSGFEFSLARLNSDGSLDTGFGSAGEQMTDLGSPGDHATSVAIQPNGKILVTGQSGSADARDFAVARYNSDGSLDTSFSGDGWTTTDFGGIDDIPTDMALQEDGRIVVVGGTSLDGEGDFAVARYQADGASDSSFSGDGKLLTDLGSDIDFAYSVAIQSDGRLVVAGSAAAEGVTQRDFAVARYDSSGTLDGGFAPGGWITTDFGFSPVAVASSVLIQPDSTLVVAGRSCNGPQCQAAVARLLGGDSPPDTIPPETTITSGPEGVVATHTPTFGFASSEPGSTFQCRVDSQAFVSCSSPHTVSPLNAGAHVFEVRAIDGSGNIDPTPATRAFTVELPGPPSNPPSQTVPPKPPAVAKLTNLKLSKKKITSRQRATLIFKLSAAARVKVSIFKTKGGVRKGKRCVKPGKARRGKRCALRVASLTRSLKAGARTVRLPKLRAGRHRIVVVQADTTTSRGLVVRRSPPRR